MVDATLLESLDPGRAILQQLARFTVDDGQRQVSAARWFLEALGADREKGKISRRFVEFQSRRSSL
jgi:hypothetical protein